MLLHPSLPLLSQTPLFSSAISGFKCRCDRLVKSQLKQLPPSNSFEVFFSGLRESSCACDWNSTFWLDFRVTSPVLSSQKSFSVTRTCLLWLAVWWARPLQVCFPVLSLHSLILLKLKGKCVLQQHHQQQASKQASMHSSGSLAYLLSWLCNHRFKNTHPRGAPSAIKSKAPPAAKGLFNAKREKLAPEA